MIFRALDDNWDWQFGRGLQNFAQGSLAVSYSLKTKILSWLGDCFFAMEDGIDWKTYLGEKGGKNQLDGAIKKIVTTEEGVQQMVSFDSSLIGRKYSATIKIITIYGDTIEVKI